MHPQVLAVTGPHATQEVMDAVHPHLPKPHDPFVDLVPRRHGHQAHAAALRLPEDQRRLQPPLHLLHHPVACAATWCRGRSATCWARRKALFEGGVKELLVISQDTSAYGVDVKYRTGFWDGKPVKTRMLELVQRAGRARRALRRLGAPALRVSVSARRRGDPADGQRPGPAVPRRAVPAQPPRRAQAHEAPGQRRDEPRAHRSAGARSAPSW